MSELKVPQVFLYMSVDEVAECTGVNVETYNELWQALDNAKNPKPLGGDGSDGTTEEPIVSSGEYGTDLVAAWPRLSEAAQLDIINAAEKFT